MGRQDAGGPRNNHPHPAGKGAPPSAFCVAFGGASTQRVGAMGLTGIGVRMRAGLFALLVALACLAVSGAVWLGSLHWFFRPAISDYYSPTGPLPPKARAIAQSHLELWQDPVKRQAELDRMRRTNAEWDFMGRTFLVLSLSNMALRQPSETTACLEVADRIISDTLDLESGGGHAFFLMDYARASDFVARNGRSLFVDGEVVLMMGARRLVREYLPYRAAMDERVTSMILQMEQSPVLCAESYPNECWMFCNCVAAAAIRITDLLNGTDHSVFLRRWLDKVRERLVHKDTGLLISSFTFEGERLDGPEGSSIWMAAHCLAVVDEAFARDQYERARRELRANVLGFGYAREWPASWHGPRDVDSGPVIPWLEVSAGSSGQAFMAATTFGDMVFLRELLTTLRFAAFPVERKGRLRFAASNQVGDAVLLYSLAEGPLWDLVRARSAKPAGANP
jgi:hypothetical protein